MPRIALLFVVLFVVACGGQVTEPVGMGGEPTTSEPAVERCDPCVAWIDAPVVSFSSEGLDCSEAAIKSHEMCMFCIYRGDRVDWCKE